MGSSGTLTPEPSRCSGMFPPISILHPTPSHSAARMEPPAHIGKGIEPPGHTTRRKQSQGQGLAHQGPGHLVCPGQGLIHQPPGHPGLWSQDLSVQREGLVPSLCSTWDSAQHGLHPDILIPLSQQPVTLQYQAILHTPAPGYRVM